MTDQSSGQFHLLFVGDIVGSSGRRALAHWLPRLKEEFRLDMVVANGENSAHGFGLTPSTAKDIYEAGVDVITGGNHIFDKKEVEEAFSQFPGQIIRPANYPPGTPGRGSTVFRTKKGYSVGLINVMGRVFMDALDCPFHAFDRERQSIPGDVKIILLDMHAEATSEKAAMGYYADGRISAFVGSHTHVPTADEQVLPKGTGFISDAGMTGPANSIIGMQKEQIIQRFLEKRPVRMQVAEGDCWLNAVVFRIQPETGQCKSVERVRRFYEERKH
jgi:metallophosphoesterase (TIGR00282 family)